MEDMLTLH